jgi:methylthioribose-1-phosphate isomerase
MIKTVEYLDGIVRMIDQTRLPLEEVFVDCATINDVAKAIKTMVVRGAPAIGVSAAMGVSLGAESIQADRFESFYSELEKKCLPLAKSRPTAVNLAWGIERMKRVARESKSLTIPELKKRLKQEAINICKEDIECNMAMGNFGQTLIKDGSTVLTHCNAGALATAGFGTALGVIRAAVNAGKKIDVLADETRPFLQGARLTVWELMQDNIPVKLITDNMSGFFMRNKQVDAVVVGADRIASNGDVANKIGTYMVAVMAQKHNIPFYVAAPISTLDLSLSSGDEIPIEQRSGDEVACLNNKRITPKGAKIAHPAFDITPNDLVTAIITDRGIAQQSYSTSLKKLAEQ